MAFEEGIPGVVQARQGPPTPLSREQLSNVPAVKQGRWDPQRPDRKGRDPELPRARHRRWTLWAQLRQVKRAAELPTGRGDRESLADRGILDKPVCPIRELGLFEEVVLEPEGGEINPPQDGDGGHDLDFPLLEIPYLLTVTQDHFADGGDRIQLLGE